MSDSSEAGPRRATRAAGIAAMMFLALAAGCGTVRDSGPWRTPAPAPAPVPGAPPSRAPAPSQDGKPAPIPDRPITLNGQCTQTEEDGYREQATLKVTDNEVKEVSWQLWVGKRGSCRFAQGDFSQTRRRPHIEMAARDGSGCKLMVWQEPRRITLAHAGCEQRCTKGIYDQAWPVMFDPVTGSCSKIHD